MQARTRPLLARLAPLAVVAAVAVAACGGSAATAGPDSDEPAPQASGVATSAARNTIGGASGSPAAAGSPEPGDGAGLSGAAENLSKITSYRFSIVMRGGSFGEMLGSEPITGTVVTSPTKAAQMSFMGMEIVEIDGSTWVKVGDQWVESEDDGTASLADSFAPQEMFGSTLSGQAAAGYRAAGEEQKNGVATVHYVADADLLSGYSSLFGLEGDVAWSAEVWVAKDGGYPVSMTMSATGDQETFEMTFDITNINDPSNAVEQPS